MTKKIKWRLAERPTSSEISLLVEKEILTKDEAREILFTKEDEKERDEKSLKDEIRFLRDLVEKLSEHNRSTIIQTIREVQTPVYIQRPWFQQYEVFCSNQTSTSQAFNQLQTF